MLDRGIERSTQVPLELTSRRQWVGWIWMRHKNKRVQKIPINPHNGRYASVTDSTTWGLYQEALKASREYSLAGIGFVFTEEDSFVGIDLDDCRNPKTGKIRKWAHKIIDDLGSYTDISPSGTGVKIVVIGKIPSSRRKGGIELYSSKRFFALTFQALPNTPHEIVQPEQGILEGLFEALSDGNSSEIEKCAAGNVDDSRKVAVKGQQTFYGLFHGGLRGKDSKSEADFALCLKLARLTHCRFDQIDKLFRQSKLIRPKWDRAYSDGSTYGQRTIKNAIDYISRVK